MKLPPAEVSSQSAPLVSYLIVTHNAGRFLLPCIESVLGQRYPRLQIVLVDSASTDDSVVNVRSIFAGARELRVVRLESNQGPAAGAVAGLPFCEGEFIARLDADDIALPHRTAVEVGYLLRRPDKDAVGCDVIRIDADGRPVGVGLSMRSEFLRRHGSKWDMGCLHTTLLVRRSSAVTRFYNPTLFAGEDFEWIESIGREGRLGLVPSVVGLYRQHGFTISTRMAGLQRLSGAELRYRLASVTAGRMRREELRVADFTGLREVAAAESEMAPANLYEKKCRNEQLWLGAAYFSSTGRRWHAFPALLGKAARRHSWRELAALVACRTLWPLWQRLHGMVFRISFRTARARPEVDFHAFASRVARRFDAWRWRKDPFPPAAAGFRWQGKSISIPIPGRHLA
jgi:glycosyltransferase involved in cell wall biosynthesis